MARIGINLVTGSLQQPEMIVGIDLGTTNSLVAIIHPETKIPMVLKEHDSSALVPSIIHFDDSNTIIVGEAAKDFLISEPHQTIFSAKRLMGKSYDDIKENRKGLSYKIIEGNSKDLVKIQVGNNFYSPRPDLNRGQHAD